MATRRTSPAPHRRNVGKSSGSGNDRSWWGRLSATRQTAYTAAIIGVVGAIIAAAIEVLGSVEQPPSQPPISGNAVCVVQGNGNHIACPQVFPASFGSIEVGQVEVSDAYYTGAIGELPKPDSASGYQRSPNCKSWGSWLSTTPGVYLINPVFSLGMESGSNDLLVIKGIDAHIERRTVLTESDVASGAYLKCLHGGGGVPGLTADVNTVERKTTVVVPDPDDPEDSSKTRRFAMPPGHISQADIGYTGTDITISSMPGRLYEGWLQLSVSVNGVDKKLEIGTATSPLRWIDNSQLGDNNLMFDERKTIPYGWNATKRQWIQGYNALYEE